MFPSLSAAHPHGRLQPHHQPPDRGGWPRPGGQGHAPAQGRGERRVADRDLPQPHRGGEHGGPGGRLLQDGQQRHQLDMEQKRWVLWYFVKSSD